MASLLRLRHLAAIFVVLAFAAAAFAAPVSAGTTPTSDPYGSTTTTTDPDPDPSCSLDQSQGTVGGQISGTIFDVEVGETLQFFLGGTEIGSLQVESGSTAAARAAEFVDAAFAFTIPSSIQPGTYSLVVTGSTFNITCVLPDGSTDFEVLGTSVTTATTQPTNNNNTKGPLAFTGLDTLPLLVLAAALLAAGIYLRRRGELRRRRMHA